MGSTRTSMTFEEFADANREWALLWHPEGLNSWSLSDWGVAMAGEAGETCNIIKKLRRADDGLIGNDVSDDELRYDLALEIADTVTYAFLLAQRAGIDLERACRIKFNQVSVKNGFPNKI